MYIPDLLNSSYGCTKLVPVYDQRVCKLSSKTDMTHLRRDFEPSGTQGQFLYLAWFDINLFIYAYYFVCGLSFLDSWNVSEFVPQEQNYR